VEGTQSGGSGGGVPGGGWGICEAGLEKDKGALLVAIGGLSDGQKVVLAVEPGYRESTESWGGALRDLKKRGNIVKSISPIRESMLGISSPSSTRQDRPL
jgi:hypothetical protein